MRVTDHMAIVCTNPVDMTVEAKGGPVCEHGQVLGCITLLDVVQRLVDERLDDEDSPRHSIRNDESKISVLAAGRLRAWAQRAKARRLDASALDKRRSSGDQSDDLRSSLLAGDDGDNDEQDMMDDGMLL